MKIEPPSVESVTVIILLCIVAFMMFGCASRVPAPDTKTDTRTDTEKRIEHLEYQQRLQQMNNLLNT